MRLFQDTGSGPRDPAALCADVLTLYASAGDAALGNPLGFSQRKAAAAVSIAKIAQIDATEQDALYFAGLLHAIGAIGNPAFRKGERLSERMARIESWDVPVLGARRCQQIAALPPETADIVRWQAECWDGTGYPDQLRWHGIPKSAAILFLADAYLRAADPDEALAAVAMQSGRAFGPEIARTFTMWFHLSGDQVEPIAPPLAALRAPDAAAAEALFDEIADAVDAHNASPGRWRRLARLCESTVEILHLDAAQRAALAVAVRLYGCGQIADRSSTDDAFDALARLGIEQRARRGSAAAAFAHGIPALERAEPILRARGEWYDGTGKPDGLLHDAIPTAAAVFSAALAYDQLDAKDRIDTAAGTQFDPHIVRALLEAARVGSL